MSLLRHPIETGIVETPIDQNITVQIQWNQTTEKEVQLNATSQIKVSQK